MIETAEALKISKERVGYIGYEYVDMRELCLKWMSSQSTENNYDLMILSSVSDC